MVTPHPVTQQEGGGGSGAGLQTGLSLDTHTLLIKGLTFKKNLMQCILGLLLHE